MGKSKKEHRKKVAKRNEAIKIEQKKSQKIKDEFLQKLIEEENKKGKFNSPVIPLPGFEGPTLGLSPTIFTGPQL